MAGAKKKVDIYMRSGSVIRINADSFSTTTSSVTGQFISLKWTGLDTALFDIDVNQVEAVVVR